MAHLRILLMVASLLPLPCLALGLTVNGTWAVVALVYMTGFAFFTDEAVRVTDANQTRASTAELWLGDLVPLVQGLAHVVLLPLAIITLARADMGWMPVAIFAAFGLYFGQFSTSNAHELIHRTNRLHHHLGKWVFISLLFGHHVTAHLTVHHRFVGTDDDPNSARINESFHRFFGRAWRGSYRAGLKVETTRLQRKGRVPYHPTNPFFIYILGALVFIGLVFVAAGWVGLGLYFGFAFFAQLQLLLSDYVQHYGLRRRLLDTGPEPVSAECAPLVFNRPDDQRAAPLRPPCPPAKTLCHVANHQRNAGTTIAL